MKVYRLEQWMQADASIHILSSVCGGEEIATRTENFEEVKEWISD